MRAGPRSDRPLTLEWVESLRTTGGVSGRRDEQGSLIYTPGASDKPPRRQTGSGDDDAPGLNEEDWEQTDIFEFLSGDDDENAAA